MYRIGVLNYWRCIYSVRSCSFDFSVVG